MVFSGKPSTGCQMCRTRRIKCDEAKPACSQCVRTSRTCPGYKSQLDLLFRNETGASAAEKRARNARKKSLAAPAAAASSSAASTATAASPSSASSTSPASISPAHISPVLAPAAQAASHAAAQSASFTTFSFNPNPIQPRPQQPSLIPVRKPARKQPAASRKTGNARAVSKNAAPVAATTAPTPPTSTAIANRNTYIPQPADTTVRIEALNSPGSYDDHFLVDTYAKASMSYVLAHRQSPEYESLNPALASFNATQGFVEEEEDTSTPSNQITRRNSSYENAQIIPALTQPTSDLAIHHFFSNFIMIPYGMSRRGYLDFLVPLMQQVNSPVANQLARLGTAPARRPQDALIPASEGALALSYAFRACALASMGTRVTSERYPFLDKAIAAYTRALAATTLALRDPVLRTADITLAAVLLLGIFESITAKQLGLFAWGSHIEGAIEVVKARSLQQRTTPIGRSLFIAVRTQMIIHSLATGKLPGVAYEWWFEDAVNDNLAAHCQRLSIRAAELRSEATAMMERVSFCMAQKPPQVMAEVRALADKAYALDRECVQWMQNLSPDWNYRSIAWQDDLPPGTDYSKAEIFPGYVDEYPDLYIVGCWNMMRGTRLCISSIGVRCAAWACWPADYRTTPEYRAAEAISKDMIQGIVSSVPFYMGFATRDNIFRRGAPDEGWTWLEKHKYSKARVYSGSSSGSDTPSPEACPATPPPWSGTAWQVDTSAASQASPAPQPEQGTTYIPTTTAMPPTTHPYSSYSTSTSYHATVPTGYTPAASPDSATAATSTSPAAVPPSVAASIAATVSTASLPDPLRSDVQHRHQRGYHYDYYSGPGHPEYESKLPPESASAVQPAQAGFMLGDDSALKGLSGYFLAWPLTNVASQDYTTDKQREFAVGRLKFISEQGGVRYAGFLSEVKFRAPSMMIRRDRSIAQQALLAATGQMGKGESVGSPFADLLGIKKTPKSP